MIVDVDKVPAIALALLEEKLHNWQKTVPLFVNNVDTKVKDAYRTVQ
ncbi:hypothetical protein ACQ438_002543 [Escherichia coli O13,129, 135:H26]